MNGRADGDGPLEIKEALEADARRAGIELERPGVNGEPIPVSAVALAHLVDVLDARSSFGAAQPSLQCHLPGYLRDRKAWGISLQLYEVRSQQNWGIGDFADLCTFVQIAGQAGADFIGLNPLHALFTADPGRCSPFAPSNRLFLNPIYISVVEIDPGAAADPAVLADLNGRAFVDYDAVMRLKLDALRRIFDAEGRSPELDAFEKAGGPRLAAHALFEALSHEMVGAGHGAGWQTWPVAYRNAASAAVSSFATEHHDDVRFHIWLQYHADRQLQAVKRKCAEAGLRVGLYLDLAVGEAPDGSATWADPDDFVPHTTVGAPPDLFSTSGQSWGLAALAPHKLAQTKGRRLDEMVRAMMRHGGAVRIDHAMALQHLFLVPEGRSPEDGAYVDYPIALMFDTIARASRDHQALVIGEDLGVVPPHFRKTMEAARLLAYRPVYFEQDENGFKPAETYPELALSCLSTHDLPTLIGWWRSHDLALRAEHGLVDPDLVPGQEEARDAEREALLRRLGLGDEPSMHELAVAAHRFLAQTASLLCAARLADMVGETEPTNLPGTSDSYPNWSRRLAVPLERLAETGLWRDIVAVMRRHPAS